MRTGAIFARGSGRALKWLVLFGVVLALGTGSAAAQPTVTINSLTLNAAEVDEGGQATATVRFTVVGDSDGVPAGATTVGFAFDVANLTTDVAATNATATSFYGLTDTASASQQNFRHGAIVANARQAYTATHTFGLNHDLDAENGKFQLEVSIGAIDGSTEQTMVSTSTYLIDDDEDQLYQLSIPAANRGAITEDGAAATVTLTANPKRTATATVPTFTVVTDPADTGFYTYARDGSATDDAIDTALSAAAVNDGAPAMFAIGTIMATRDKNRVADTVTLKLYSGSVGASSVQHELTLTVRDAQPLAPAANITAVAKDKDSEDVTSMAEGGDPVYLTISVDRGRGSTATTTETLTIDIEPANPVDAVQYVVEPDRVTLPAVAAAGGKQSTTTEIKLSARADDDIGPMDLDLNLVVSGDAEVGTETSTGMFSIAITDRTDALVSVKEDNDEAYDAIKAALGDPPILNKGMSRQIMTADLFTWDPMAVSVSFGTSVEGAAVSASTSGEMVTIMADAEGDAKVTVTATATSMSSSLMVNQTVSNIAQLTFPVKVALDALSVAVEAADMEIMEGGNTMITATANRVIEASDGEVTINLSVAPEGSAMLDPMSITIAAGSMSGSAMLTAPEDDDYDDEMVTVIASGSGIIGPQQIAITVTDDDEPPVDEPTVSAKLQEAVDAVFATAIVTAAGGPDWVEGGDAAMVNMSTLFNVAEGASPSYSGMSSDDMTVSTSSSGMMLTLSPVAAGMATITVTATDAASGDIATAMSEVTVADLPLSVSVSAAAAMVAEGSSVALTATANQAVDADTMVKLMRDGASTADADDYSIEGDMITIAAGEMTGTAMLMATDDHDVEGNESLTLLATVGDMSAGMVMVTIEDNDAETTYTLSASAESVEEGGTVTITATASQMVRANTEVMVMRDGASTADGDDYSLEPPLITIMEGETEGSLTLTATDDHDVEGNENLTLNGMVGDMAAGSVMLAITDNDMDITYTLSGPEDMNLAEGMSAELTATASSAVHMDTEVMIMRDGSSTASDADYTAESIMIMAGETVGTTMVMAVEDNEPDSGSGSPEMLTLYGMVDGMQTNSVSFYLWDAAVPALPVIAQLLLAAFLAIGGYRRYQRR